MFFFFLSVSTSVELVYKYTVGTAPARAWVQAAHLHWTHRHKLKENSFGQSFGSPAAEFRGVSVCGRPPNVYTISKEIENSDFQR